MFDSQLVRYVFPCVLVVAVCAPASVCWAQRPDGPPLCPTTFSALEGKVDSLLCRCDDAAQEAGGSVWGTSIYTQDSSVCRAAAHAGAIDPTSGVVVVKAAAGCDGYLGTVRNGLTSSSWGPYQASFFFPSHGDGACAALGKDACPGTYAASAAGTQGIACTCYAEQLTGPVWGTDIYTQDSSLCLAAQHVGVIDASGGKVEALGASGCEAYVGSPRNGVKSSSWGPYEKSFVFKGRGGKCAPQESLPCPQSFAGGGKVKPGEALLCTCSPGTPTGSVWGTGVYTQDSSVCAAALHAGLITSAGGVIEAQAREGCEAFKGSEANGVKTSSWGPYQGGFIFPKMGKASCAALPNDMCPATFKAVQGAAPGMEISCTCPSGAAGPVWGSGVYTADSSLCAAARHSGAVGEEGGKVTLRGLGGCAAYAGSQAHGVTTSDWASYKLSFTFPGFGKGVCQ